MTLAIPLYFDPATESAIQAVWEVLAERQIAPYMAFSGIRPHITLAIFRDIDRHACQQILAPMVDSLDPLPITFSHLGIFSTPAPVVFLAPTITPDLLALHRKIYDLLDEEGDQPDPYYIPGNWVPHCTLAVEFEPVLISQAVDVARTMVLPLKGWAAELCLIEYPPFNHIFSLPMKNLKESTL